MSTIKGITHVIINMNSLENYKTNKIGASATICFGKDQDCINGIIYMGETRTWSAPIGFGGEIAIELLGLVGRAADKVKKEFPPTKEKPLEKRSFRVTANKVEEIIEEKK